MRALRIFAPLRENLIPISKRSIVSSRRDAKIRKARIPPAFFLFSCFVGELLNKFGDHRRNA